MFWCLYIAKNGIHEYNVYSNMMKDSRKKFEMEMKIQIIDEITKKTHILLSRKSATEYKFTKVRIHEILSRMLMVESRTCLYTCLAICKVFDIGVFLIDKSKHTYVPINVVLDGAGAGNNKNVFLLYKATTTTAGNSTSTSSLPHFSINLEKPTTAAIAVIRDKYVQVLIGAKPLHGISRYKKTDLEALMLKLSTSAVSSSSHPPPIPQNSKKNEIYEWLWVHMNWDRE